MNGVTQYNNREIARAFGQVLRTARTDRGISQDRLSEICDLDRTYPSLLGATRVA
jgi:ribosome-binding protein aMBF1 (putative translation factor)